MDKAHDQGVQKRVKTEGKTHETHDTSHKTHDTGRCSDKTHQTLDFHNIDPIFPPRGWHMTLDPSPWVG